MSARGDALALVPLKGRLAAARPSHLIRQNASHFDTFPARGEGKGDGASRRCFFDKAECFDEAQNAVFRRRLPPPTAHHVAESRPVYDDRREARAES